MRLRSLLFLLLLASIATLPASAQQGSNRWDPRFASLSVGGGIRAVVITEQDIFVGGDFTHVAGIPVRNIARWSRAEERWHPMGEGVDGEVRALAVTDAGTLIVAGLFGTAGNVASNGIAAWDGASWSSIGGGVSGGNAAVYAVAVVGTTIYAGGNFTHAGTIPANSIARWDGINWAPLGEGITGTGAIVLSLAVSNNQLFAGGRFSQAGTAPATGLAVWKESQWSAAGTFAGTGEPFVSALAVSGGRLFVGGAFNNVGVTAHSIAQLDISTNVWEAVGAGLDGTVNAIFPLGDSVIIGGEFSQRGKRDSSNLALFSGGTLSVFSGGTRGIAYALSADPTTFCVGGLLTRAGSTSVVNIGLWSRRSGLWSVPGRGVAGGINFIATRPPNQVFVTGELQMSKGLQIPYLGMWDGEEWQDIGGLSGTGDAILIEGDDVIVGGAFNIAGGNGDCTGIGRYNLSTKKWTPYATGTPGRGRVSAIVRFRDTLFMAGRFAFGDSILNIAKWDGSRWRPVGLGVTGTVRTLAVVGGRLYAAGDLTSAGGMPVSNIAWWDGNAWNRLGTEANNGANGTIHSVVAAPDGSLFVAGEFFSVGEVFSDNIARWDGESWSSIAGTNGPIYRLHLNNGKLYVGGLFARADAASVNNLATYELSTGVWDNFNDGATGSPGATVRGIATLGNDLFIGGYFPYAGSVQAWNFARFGFVVTDAGSNPPPPAPRVLNTRATPNPAVGDKVTLRFTLPEASPVTVRLFAADGKEVLRPFSKLCEAGEQAITFRPTITTASQLLFYRVEAGELREGGVVVIGE